MFTQKLPSEWFKARRQAIVDVRQTWGDIERVVIGSFLDMITSRVEKNYSELAAKVINSKSETTHEALAGYLTDTLDGLLRDSVQSWLPVALDFVDDFEKPKNDHPRRAPQTIWYALPSGKDIENIVDQWFQQASVHFTFDDPDLRAHPPAVFAFAATVALYAGDWANADRFADLALRTNKAWPDKNRGRYPGP